MARKSWNPLPAITLLTGEAEFFKKLILKRFSVDLFGTANPEIRTFQATPGDRQGQGPTLAEVLDELRTPSFFSANRIVTLEHGGAFLTAHGETLIPFLEGGFAGGHFIVFIDGKLDGRTRFAKAVAKAGWIVECAQPYDRPPPWDQNTPVWDSALTHWIVAHAQGMDLTIAPQTAFLLHQRAGTELSLLAEELEKLATFLSSKNSKTVDAKAVTAVVGDLREDTVFQAVELFLEGRRVDALSAVTRLFAKGYHTNRGPVTDPTSISLLFVGALVPRLRALRRAHAMAAEGDGPEQWTAAGVVQRPFISRFERHLRAVRPRKLVRLLERLYVVDKSIKSGGDAERLLEMLVIEFGAPG
jgi:DNA polymerase-3 subunit delta